MPKDRIIHTHVTIGTRDDRRKVLVVLDFSSPSLARMCQLAAKSFLVSIGAKAQRYAVEHGTDAAVEEYEGKTFKP